MGSGKASICWSMGAALWWLRPMRVGQVGPTAAKQTGGTICARLTSETPGGNRLGAGTVPISGSRRCRPTGLAVPGPPAARSQRMGM